MRMHRNGLNSCPPRRLSSFFLMAKTPGSRALPVRSIRSLEKSFMNDTAEALTPIDKVIRLQTVDVFKHATTEMLARIGSIAGEVRAAEGDVVFREDDVSDAMYVVVQGQVRLDRGEEHVMMVAGGKSFGTWALFDNQPRMMKATAV